MLSEKIFKMKKIYYTPVLMALLLSFVSCGQGTDQTKEGEEDKQDKFCLNEEFKKKIALEPLAYRPVKEQISLTGSISYNEDDVVKFKSMLEGVVENVQFNLGQFVKRGQVLATVRSTSVNDMSNERQSLTNQIALARQKVSSTQSMFQDGLASARQVEEVRMELATLQSALQSLDANMNLYNATSHRGVFEIKAPKDGYIVEKNLNPGANINNEDQLFALSNLRQIWVMVNIYANNLQYVKNGATVAVKTLAYPDEIFTGKIQQISNVFDQDERVLKARVLLDNADLRLKPGMSADVIIDKSSLVGESLIAIPNHAIIFNNNQKYAVVYNGDCDLLVMPIKAVAENNEYTYVREGYKEGDQVITKNELIVFEELMK
ncbi:efflux transporter, RND family, MFP subunit [Sphingobacterium spiritivorum ATCC 33300]|uniref:Efflux transporter, RND family, MFP subunit n=2 Tax=Sphingobacterium spiritivorum TaxID=258 RepID=C2FT12_SPHSI|nr:efflux transporter, RND family, MFP subunit [Sphingobacterium spiritivorum ATCC 33300]QQS94411.1 efflux RND transporter periplasmic adaptor subunit [Sphingobacterium spiritivorum]